MKIHKPLLKAAGLWLAAIFVLQQGTFAQELITITHSGGETKVAKNPKRVVVFDMGSLETYHELGIPVVGGPEKVPDYLAGFKERNPEYQGTGSVARADLAIVEQLKPDLIIIGGRLRSVYDSLSAIAPTVLFGTDANDYWPSFEKNVRTIASLHGKEQLAEEKLAALRKKVELVQAKSKDDQGKALFVLHVNERFNPNGPKSRFGFGYDVLGLKAAYTPDPSTADAGGPRGGGGTGAGTPGQQRPERPQGPTLAQIDPDYLFIIDRATGIQGTMPALGDLLTDDVKATKAYKNGKVFLLPGNIWYLSGGGLVSVDSKITDIGEKLYRIKF
ncbi:siderophore ABC transporter substrate-binding protein [Olivibacter sitiensis]|uniref:siderophore ABC transporter substrate-binding protein n=1 Tax=Olivibacter sitiensis TaxID=376470 RepID=UPI0012F84102|nr:ABC transporter substrate-binding protein [Olivibacter sitiensis]